MLTKIQKFILFFVNDEMWATPLTSGNQFVSCDNIVPLPDVAKEVVGLMYGSGHIVTILDTAGLLSIRTHSKQYETCLLFNYENDHYGLLVDAGGDTVKVKRILTDRSKNRTEFKKYIKFKNKKVYILYPEDIWKKIGIYD
jgi:chemotaxis signal transduction protein